MHTTRAHLVTPKLSACTVARFLPLSESFEHAREMIGVMREVVVAATSLSAAGSSRIDPMVLLRQE
jgi:hypothetical protein